MPISTNAVQVERESMLLVYDQEGRILKVHHFVTAVGGKHPSEEEQEEATMKLARGGRTRIKDLSLLRVEPQNFDLAKNYRVDPAKRALVETPRLTRRGEIADPEFPH